MSELDGFVQLGDAQVRYAEGQATAIDTLADVPKKLAEADLVAAQAAHQRLENLAKWLDIVWDSQAHYHLLRARTQALQKARQADLDAKQFRSHARNIYGLLTGISWDSVRNGWISFDYVLTHVPTNVLIDGLSVVPDAAAFGAIAWSHIRLDTRRSYSESDTLPQGDPGELLRWAKLKTMYPRLQGPAWRWIASVLQTINEGAKQAAAELETRLAALQADARSLEQEDWSRLKQPNDDAQK